MSEKLDKNKINSLIQLLEDDDSQVYEMIHSQIIDMGPQLMPFLLDAEDNSLNPGFSIRVKNVFNELNLTNTINEIRAWKNNNSRNLYQGMSILSQFQYPRLELKKISDIINKMRQDLWLEVNDNLTALEKVRIINHLFFEVYGFKGDIKDYYAIENSFINDVLLRKKGNPITLSVIYSILAQSVNIPIYGVNLPRNYMLVYVEKLYTQPISKTKASDVLFYINPFNKGEIHSYNDIQNYLRRIQIEPKEEYYLPCPNLISIERTLNNIINIYTKTENLEKADSYQQILNALKTG